MSNATFPLSTGDPQSGEEEHPLNPCPACNAVPHDHPEISNDVRRLRGYVGEDELAKLAHPWTRLHCWRCGYRPTTDIEEQTRRNIMWNQFQDWYNGRPELRHQSVSTDNGGPSADQRAQALQPAQQVPSQVEEDKGATPEPVQVSDAPPVDSGQVEEAS